MTSGQLGSCNANTMKTTRNIYFEHTTHTGSNRCCHIRTADVVGDSIYPINCLYAPQNEVPIWRGLTCY